MQAPKVLEPVADGVWHSEHDLFLPGGVHFRTRMVVLSTGRGLMLYGPVPLDPAHAERVAQLGQVTDVLAPNAFHHLFARPALERFDTARLHLAGALKTKRPSLEGQLIEPDKEPSWPELETALLGGMPKLDEVVAYHHPSRTLVVTDLVFNIMEYQNAVSGVVFRLMGTHKKLAQSRLLRRVIRDQAAMRASLERVFSWDFDRVVMAHGEILAQHAKDRLAEILLPQS